MQMLPLAAILVIKAAVLGPAAGWHWPAPGEEAVGAGQAAHAFEEPAPDDGPPGSIVFVGDIMLARDVERTLYSLGPAHLFAGLGDLFAAGAVVGNFEASVPEAHQPTPNFEFKFSVAAGHLQLLADAGLTHLSLANNHALDHGASGYRNTVRELSGRGLAAFGHPSSVSGGSVAYVEMGDERVALIALNATFGYPAEAVWKAVVEEAAAETDFQIVYIHWGEEYELIHDAAQEIFAKSLIEAGADLIVGHHPHVVQDVWRYGGAVVFYSLGNLIFDQYWNDEVRTGLAIELLREEGKRSLRLVPVESKTVRLQPRPMAEKEKADFLDHLARRSDPALSSAIGRGLIEL